MSMAMMLPVALPAVGHVGFNSLRRRRRRAMALYVCVYVGVWAVFGLAALSGERWLREVASLDRSVLLAGALALAAVWQVSWLKRRALNQCLRTVPLPPVGLRADVGCAHFAVRHGWRCIQSCWALMIVMAIVGHAGLLALGAMAALTALIAVEELTRNGNDVLAPSAGVLALAAGLIAGGRWA
jgi:predicted metal-binding membrane protein